YHQNCGIGHSGLQRCLGPAALEAFVAGTKYKTLHTTPTWYQCQTLRQQMLVVDTGRGIDEVDRGNIAFAATRRIDPAETTNGDGARAPAPLTQSTDHDIERNIMTAHDDEIGRALGFADQRNFGLAPRIER